MKYLVIDTCIVLHILRGKQQGLKCIDAINQYDSNAVIILSVVTKAELEALRIKRGWGEPRCKALRTFLEKVIYVDISNTDDQIINSYSRIEAYSQRILPDDKGDMLNGSAKQMSKNDVWIAATAHVLDVPLMTADNDFDHLDNTLMSVIKIQ